MLFTESQLNRQINPFLILESAIYLTSDESRINPKTIAIKENSRLGSYVVDYDNIRRLQEEYNISTLDSISLVSEFSEIDPVKIIVQLDESDIIEDPNIVQEVSNYVVTPISTFDPVFQYVQEIANAYLESGDMTVLNELEIDLDKVSDKIVNSPFGRAGNALADFTYHGGHGSEKEKIESKYDAMPYTSDNELNRRKELDASHDKWLNRAQNVAAGVTFGGMLGAAGGTAFLGYKGIKAIQNYRNKPKSVIAKKIASLRSIYQKWMDRASNCKDSGLVSRLKAGAAKILQVIDKLLAILQKKAG